MKITIEIPDAEHTSDKLSDILCWWNGYKMGLKTHGELPVEIVNAQDGMETVLDLAITIKTEIARIKKT